MCPLGYFSTESVQFQQIEKMFKVIHKATNKWVKVLRMNQVKFVEYSL